MVGHMIYTLPFCDLLCKQEIKSGFGSRIWFKSLFENLCWISITLDHPSVIHVPHSQCFQGLCPLALFGSCWPTHLTQCIFNQESSVEAVEKELSGKDSGHPSQQIIALNACATGNAV